MKNPVERINSIRPEQMPQKEARKVVTVLITILLMVFMYSCGSNSTGVDDNGGNGNGGGNGGGEIGTEPTFANVGQIFQTSCTPCHISQTTNGVRLNSYSNVINSVGTQYGTNVVVPGDANGSPLVDKIEPSPQFGVRMPEGGPYLSAERIAQIRQWINDGAENN
jgi:hypothetical protein